MRVYSHSSFYKSIEIYFQIRSTTVTYWLFSTSCHDVLLPIIISYIVERLFKRVKINDIKIIMLRSYCKISLNNFVAELLEHMYPKYLPFSLNSCLNYLKCLCINVICTIGILFILTFKVMSYLKILYLISMKAINLNIGTLSEYYL